MPITVRHSPNVNVIGAAAERYGSYTRQREDQLRAEDRMDKFAMKKMDQDFNREMQDAAFERDMQKMQFADKLQQRQEERELGLLEKKYTSKQKLEMEQINNQMDEIEQRSDLSVNEKQYMMKQLEAKKYGITPREQPVDKLTETDFMRNMYTDPVSGQMHQFNPKTETWEPYVNKELAKIEAKQQETLVKMVQSTMSELMKSGLDGAMPSDLENKFNKAMEIQLRALGLNDQADTYKSKIVDETIPEEKPGFFEKVGNLFGAEPIQSSEAQKANMMTPKKSVKKKLPSKLTIQGQSGNTIKIKMKQRK